MRPFESRPVRVLLVLLTWWSCSNGTRSWVTVPEQDGGAATAGVKGPFQGDLAAGPGTVDAGEPEAGVGVPEDSGSSPPHAAQPPPDAGAPPAEIFDAGTPRVGVHDAGSPTTGVKDAGTANGGQPDAGVPPGCPSLFGTLTSITAGTWCVTGDVIIPHGTTLVVPPGTTFIFMGRFHFGRDPAKPDSEPPAIVGSGSLHAIGTQAQPIVFRGATPTTGWFGIVIDHSDDTVHLEWVTIRDTHKDDPNPSSRIWIRGGALGSYVNAKGTIIRHSTFVNNHTASVAGALDINGHGSWPNAGPVEITDSLFEDNWCDCVRYSYSSTDLCGGGAIRLSHVGGDASLVKIQRNVFKNNRSLRTGSIDAYGGAIGGFDSAVIIGPGNVFQNNHADTGDGALSCSHRASLGTIITAVDPSVTFSGNTPDTGCGL